MCLSEGGISITHKKLLKLLLFNLSLWSIFVMYKQRQQDSLTECDRWSGVPWCDSTHLKELLLDYTSENLKKYQL